MARAILKSGMRGSQAPIVTASIMKTKRMAQNPFSDPDAGMDEEATAATMETFVFPGVELAPAEYLLLVRDVAAFETKYGAGLPIAGQYDVVVAGGGLAGVAAACAAARAGASTALIERARCVQSIGSPCKAGAKKKPFKR